MMTPEKMIEVIQAHADGKQIECRQQGRPSWHARSSWHAVTDPIWNFEEYEYRIKPSPRTVWIRYYADGSTHTFTDLGTAQQTVFHNSVLVEFQEVLK